MPIDFLSIQHAIDDAAARMTEQEAALAQKRERAQELLEEHSADVTRLRRAVEAASDADTHLRCAIPGDEPLRAAIGSDARTTGSVVLAADGSQIAPDRHAAVLFALINIGAVVMRTGSGAAPEVHTFSELLTGEQLETDEAMLSEDRLALERDTLERSRLSELAKNIAAPAIVLTDGPLELWGEEGAGYKKAVEAHLGSLSRLQAAEATAAGYVDRPGADLVVRMLELSLADLKDREVLRKFRPLRGVSDRWLFGFRNSKFQLLQPGERSAVFGLQSSASRRYTGALSLHFFYLNVGDAGHPYPVRVEVPRWVAQSHEKLDVLQAVLVEQCQVMGTRPYPYILHRAHETAVVSLDEKRQLETRLMQEMMRRGYEPDTVSSKQSAKDLAGRTRM